MAHTIGIDLGTTNSVVAFLEGGKAEVIPNAEGSKTTPSVVLLSGDDDPVVGAVAKRQLITQPERVIRSVKRFIGSRLEEVQDRLAGIHYPLLADDEGMAVIEVSSMLYKPEEISAAILYKMKQTAEDYLGEEIEDAVITVPAYFNDSQRQATKAAGQLAGLRVLRIINEPTAAALAYGVSLDEDQRVAVFDFGGGTFDVTLLEISGDTYEVLSTNGDCALGGDDIDQLVYQVLRDRIREQTGIDPEGDKATVQRIREAAETAKCELSSLTKVKINLPFIVANEEGPQHFESELTRKEYEALIAPILERLLEPCRNALRDAKLEPKDLDQVLLVGGSTRIPAVQHLVGDFFSRPPSKSVNPDEIVAMGAAIQAGVITGSLEEVLLLDVTPLSLGIELAGGVFSTLIPRNSNIPIVVEKSFTTVVDNQKAVNVHVLQGERKVAAENRSLAHFKLNGIAPAPKDLPEIKVRFMIDANGILNVSATDVTSGNMMEVTVASAAQTSTEEAERVAAEAEEKIEQDLNFLRDRRRIQQARDFSAMVQNFMDSYEDRLAPEDLHALREKMFSLDVNIQAGNVEGVANAEGELINIGGRYKDLFYSHKASWENK
ncbi:molecular chaperone DnaK [Candidatus Sumerlaeota bacterium]|nr:molecular chaperone DnaK [Candidatus Sumerlaeota bacterium]